MKKVYVKHYEKYHFKLARERIQYLHFVDEYGGKSDILQSSQSYENYTKKGHTKLKINYEKTE